MPDTLVSVKRSSSSAGRPKGKNIMWYSSDGKTLKLSRRTKMV